MKNAVMCISHPPAAAFQARLLDNQEGASANSVTYRTIRLRKALGEMFSNADFFWHQHYSDCGDIERGQSAQGCVMYTVVYDSLGMQRVNGVTPMGYIS